METTVFLLKAVQTFGVVLIVVGLILLFWPRSRPAERVTRAEPNVAQKLQSEPSTRGSEKAPQQKEEKIVSDQAPHQISLETVSPIPAEVPAQRRWTLEVQGAASIVDKEGNTHQGEIVALERTDAAVLSSGFGRLEYGQRPEGYPSWIWRNGGIPGKPGGAIAVPYSVSRSGEFYVGIFPEKRLAGDLETPPGGFIAIGEELEAGVYRELAEETGITGKLMHLDHGGLVANRAFDVSIQGGNLTEVYALPVGFALLRREPGTGLVLAKQPKAELQHKKYIGGVVKVRFVPILEYLAWGQDPLGVTSAGRVYASWQLGLLPSP